VTFTWLMGLMGFARSGIRQHWHVWEVMRDYSDQAFTPALGYAANMISACVLIFLSLVAFIFWLGGLAERAAHAKGGEPRGVAIPPGVTVTGRGTAPVSGD
jgi:cytochrome bd ubiquinol oxidase subunit I